MPNKLPSIQYSPPWAKGGGEWTKCKKPSKRRPVSALPHTPSLDSFGSAFIRNYLVSSSSSLKPFTKYFLSAVSLSFLTRLLPLRQIWASYTSPIWEKKKKKKRASGSGLDSPPAQRDLWGGSGSPLITVFSLILLTGSLKLIYFMPVISYHLLEETLWKWTCVKEFAHLID